MAENKDNTGKAVFIIVIILTILISAFGIIASQFGEKFNFSKPDIKKDFSSKNFFSKTPSSTQKPHGKYIAKLCIEGTIEEANSTYNQKWLLNTIDDLKYDDNNVGIILYLDTPGGGVYEADEVYLALLDYKTTGKPLYAYMGPLAASGGYYIACAADRIFANRNTLTGSIGVIAGGSLDLTKLMENVGIKYTTVHAGKNKNMGNYNEPLSDEQRAIYQGIADECYDQFTSIVAVSRKMKKDDVIKLADGRVYTAKQAQKNGLVDTICSFDDTVEHMNSIKFSGADYEAVEYSYEQKRDLYSFLLGTMSAIHKATSSSAVNLPQEIEEAITPKAPYPAYIYEGNR